MFLIMDGHVEVYLLEICFLWLLRNYASANKALIFFSAGFMWYGEKKYKTSDKREEGRKKGRKNASLEEGFVKKALKKRKNAR